MSKEILLVWQGTNDKIAAKIKKLDEERNQLLSRLNTISKGLKIIAYNEKVFAKNVEFRRNSSSSKTFEWIEKQNLN